MMRSFSSSILVVQLDVLLAPPEGLHFCYFQLLGFLLLPAPVSPFPSILLHCEPADAVTHILILAIQYLISGVVYSQGFPIWRERQSLNILVIFKAIFGGALLAGCANNQYFMMFDFVE